MNGITINDKQYIFVNSDKITTRCDDCDLRNHLCNGLCCTMVTLCGLRRSINYVFKELKVEK